MKFKFYFLITFLILVHSVSATHLTNPGEGLGGKKKSKYGNRTFGLGLNYTYPATGLSARFSFTENLKGQVSFNYRNYRIAGFGYAWSNIGAELNYAFDEKKSGFGAWYPFLYAGGGRGSINWKDKGSLDNYS